MHKLFPCRNGCGEYCLTRPEANKHRCKEQPMDRKASNSWHILCDLEEYIPQIEPHTERANEALGPRAEWQHIHDGWEAVRKFAESHQAEAAVMIANLTEPE